jgi:hypothetical protein
MGAANDFGNLGHVTPEWAVTIGRNTQPVVVAFQDLRHYRDPDTGAVINVNSNGVVFSQDPLTGCVLNGNLSLIDTNYNAYRVQYSFSGCRSPYIRLNGTTARGLGTLDTTSSPQRAVIGVVSSSAGYSLAGAYPRI